MKRLVYEYFIILSTQTQKFNGFAVINELVIT